MTDLERIELALRKAMSAPNPHAKCEVYFRNFVDELTAMNNEQRQQKQRETDNGTRSSTQKTS
jgi:hypothetical protein